MAMIACLSTQRHLVQLKAVEAGTPRISVLPQQKKSFETVWAKGSRFPQIHSCTSHFASVLKFQKKASDFEILLIADGTCH